MIRKDEIPEFTSEAEEAAWWDAHRDETAAWHRAAVERRQTTTLADVLSKSRNAADVVDPADLARARALAKKQGVSYPAFLKRLFHEAVEREERKVAS